MKLKWERYFYDLWSAVLKNVGLVIAGSGGVNMAHASGMDVPMLNLQAFGIFILAAGVIPALGLFWQKTPLPEIETETVTTTKVTERTTPSMPPPSGNSDETQTEKG